MPTTAVTLAAWLDLGDLGDDDVRLAWLGAISAATVESIEERCTVEEAGVTWSARQELAGLMLGARLYRRRSSPGGQEGFDPVALAAVLAQDPDIAELIGSTERVTGFA